MDLTDPSSPSARFTSEVLSIEVEGQVATLWLDRPEKRNALGPAFWSDLPRAVAAIEAEPGLRAVVVAAKGPHFSVGLDLVAMAGLLAGGDQSERVGPGEQRASGGPGRPAPDDGTSGGPRLSAAARAGAARREIVRLQASVTAVAECRLPTVAAIHGYCIGGGVDLAAACDIRLASADALLSVRETKVAIVADLGSLQRLPRIIGQGHVAELAFTGKDITAQRARDIGLVNGVAADAAAVLAEARALAGEIAANSPLAVQGTKAILAAGEGRSVRDGLDYVATWNAAFMASDDLAEAMAAFVEKRPADFTGS